MVKIIIQAQTTPPGGLTPRKPAKWWPMQRAAGSPSMCPMNLWFCWNARTCQNICRRLKRSTPWLAYSQFSPICKTLVKSFAYFTPYQPRLSIDCAQIEMNLSYIGSWHHFPKLPFIWSRSSWKCRITSRMTTIGWAPNHWCLCWMSPRTRQRRRGNVARNVVFRFPARISGHGCLWPKSKPQPIRSN